MARTAWQAVATQRIKIQTYLSQTYAMEDFDGLALDVEVTLATRTVECDADTARWVNAGRSARTTGRYAARAMRSARERQEGRRDLRLGQGGRIDLGKMRAGRESTGSSRWASLYSTWYGCEAWRQGHEVRCARWGRGGRPWGKAREHGTPHRFGNRRSTALSAGCRRLRSHGKARRVRRGE